MMPEMRNLLQLQEIDQELHRLQLEVKRFEPVLAGLQRDRDRRAAQQRKRKQDIATTSATRRELEKELQIVEAKLPKLLGQQAQVRTTREADALQHEIEALKMSASELEEQILELLDQEEKLSAAHAKSYAQEAQLEAEAIGEEERLKSLRNERADLAKSLQGDRIAAANRLGELSEDYTWILRKHGPSVVVPLDNGSCSGCGSMIVPHLALNVVQEKELTRCPSCHRFLRKPGNLD